MSKSIRGESDYIDCDCGDHNCNVRFVNDNCTDYLHVEFELRTCTSWFKRLKQGFKYIFGITNTYGEYHEQCWTTDNAKECIVILNKFIEKNRS